MRIGTFFFEELTPDVFRALRPGPHLHGRVLMARWLADRVIAHPDVSEMVLCTPERDLLPGMRHVPCSAIDEWLMGGSVVWFEPARHYWWRPALLRRSTGRSFPIVCLAHGIGYPHQMQPLMLSLVMPPHPGDLVIAPSHVTAATLRQQCET